MKTVTILLAGILFVPLVTRSQEADTYNVPQAVRECIARQPGFGSYELSNRINPFYLRGDFDAVLIREKATGRRGVCVCLETQAYILGAGKSFLRSDGYDFVDFDFEAWRIDPRREVSQAPEEGPPPRLRGEPIDVFWPERANGIIYWDGRAFAYYQLGG
jgi:hypothetical protein